MINVLKLCFAYALLQILLHCDLKVVQIQEFD